MILPSGVLAANGKPGANDRIVTGHIGVGGKGRGHIRSIPEHVGAICDVDTLQAEEAAKLVGRDDIFIYSDYRHYAGTQGHRCGGDCFPRSLARAANDPCL